jgi:hypothetical protein
LLLEHATELPILDVVYTTASPVVEPHVWCSLPLGATVVDAELNLARSSQSGSGAPDSKTHDLDGHAGDGIVTLADADAGVYVDSTQVTTSRPYFDVTPFIQPLRAGGDPIAGFNMRSTYQGGWVLGGWNERLAVGSRESTSFVSPPPTVTVISQPVVSIAAAVGRTSRH